MKGISKWLLVLVLIATFLAVPALTAFADDPDPMYEAYNPSVGTNLDYGFMTGTRWEAQTFTATSNHQISSVKIRAYKVNSPGTLTVSIRATSGGVPTGSDLSTAGTFDTSSGFPTSDPGGWVQINLGSPCSVTNGLKYAIVCRVSGSGSNSVRWIKINYNPYNAGTRFWSTNSGSSWSSETIGSATDGDMLFEIWGPQADQTPPVTTKTDTGTQGNIPWWLSNVTVTLTATDEAGGSGVASTWYNLDGAGWMAYTVPVIVSGDGTHTFDYYSIDNAGNQEATQSQQIMIDTTPPTVTIIVPPNGAKYYVGQVVLSNYTATDVTSGVDPSTYNPAPFPNVDTSSAGPKNFTVTAQDYAGNTGSATNSYNVSAYSVFAANGDITLNRSDVMGGLLGAGNGNITSNNGPTGGSGARATGNFANSGGGGFVCWGDIVANGNISFPGGGGNPPNLYGGKAIAGGSITDPNNGIPAANEFPFQPLPVYTPPTLPTPIADFSGLPGLGNRGAGDLAPGTYNNVNIGEGTLTLHSGTYIMNSLTSTGGAINIDLSTAPYTINIFIKGDLWAYRNNVKVNLTGGGTAADVYWEVHGTGESGGGNGFQFIGTLYTPNGSIKMANNNSVVYGALYAGKAVIFGNSTTVNWVLCTVTGAPAFP